MLSVSQGDSLVESVDLMLPREQGPSWVAIYDFGHDRLVWATLTRNVATAFDAKLLTVRLVLVLQLRHLQFDSLHLVAAIVVRGLLATGCTLEANRPRRRGHCHHRLGNPKLVRFRQVHAHQVVHSFKALVSRPEEAERLAKVLLLLLRYRAELECAVRCAVCLSVVHPDDRSRCVQSFL